MSQKAVRKARLTISQILAWAERHRERTGRWPTHAGGAIAGRRGETWATVNYALREGNRGLSGRTTLAQLLVNERGKAFRRPPNRLPLSLKAIVSWIEAYVDRTGQGPTRESGPVVEAPRESWRAIGGALLCGLRGLPKGFSLSFLVRHHLVARLQAHREHGLWVGRTRGATPAEYVIQLVADKLRRRQEEAECPSAAETAGTAKVLDVMKDLHTVARQPWSG
jgi:hypothetical protein